MYCSEVVLAMFLGETLPLSQARAFSSAPALRAGIKGSSVADLLICPVRGPSYGIYAYHKTYVAIRRGLVRR